VRVPIVQVDAFTDRCFAGNPAAVCLLEAPQPEAWMQSVAAEMNLSETAFLVPRGDGWSLRWFTPAVEVDLCGHATLASAHVLWEEGRLPHEAGARFHTRSGMLSARRREDWIELDFPSWPPAACPVPQGLTEALGAHPDWIGRHRGYVLVEVGSQRQVSDLRPDFTRLRALRDAIIVTSRSDEPGVDFVSRFFAPAYGIDEDPATGSAHCVLAPYWRGRLGKSQFVARQISRRGGTLKVEDAGERTLIAGQAVTVLRGELV
jgi:predicted PhzF superfamily epimerase YddE/YHI9